MWGTSTGSIITSMLACGHSMEEIFKHYVCEGVDIFKKKRGLFSKSKYSNEFIISLLKEKIGDITFNELYEDTQIELNLQVVNASDYNQETWNYKTRPNTKVRDGVLCSISAPTYFPEQNIDGNVYIDGGTGVLNCSLRKAVNDMLFVKEIPSKDFFVLSLGCGRYEAEYPLNKMSIKRLLWTAFFGREQSIIQQEKEFEYRKKDYGINGVRYNVNLTKHLNEMDDTDNIKALIDLIDDKAPLKEERFL